MVRTFVEANADLRKARGKSNGPKAAPDPVVEITKPPTDTGRPSKGFETGRDAFMRIAEKRVNGLLGKLNTLAKLASGKSKYGYTDGDVEQIRSTLVNAVNATADRLRRKPIQDGFSFERGKDAGA
jgi:hypothetical protein